MNILSCLKHHALGDLFVTVAHIILIEMQMSKRGICKLYRQKQLVSTKKLLCVWCWKLQTSGEFNQSVSMA